MTVKTLSRRLEALERCAGLGPVERTRIEVWFKGDDGLWRTSVPPDPDDGLECGEQRERGLTEEELTNLPLPPDVFSRRGVVFV